MEKEIKTSTFSDFCQIKNYKRRFIWWVQSLIFANVHYYFDSKQQVFCRRIDNVLGEVIDGYFIPKHNLLVGYKQKLK